jgi:hypothetical protein
VIKIERRTSDTGERKQFFGRAARHLVSHVTRSYGPETVIDGWYIEGIGLSKGKSGSGGSFAVSTLAAAARQSPAPPRIELEQVGLAPEGLSVWQKMTSTVAGNSPNYESVSEVTGLSERALPDQLFQPPTGLSAGDESFLRRLSPSAGHVG